MTVRTLRLAAGLTQAQLAERAGISTNTVANIETGKFHPQPGTLQRLATALGVTTQHLAGAPEVEGTLVVRLSPGALKHVEALCASGLWGRTTEETAEQLVLRALRQVRAS